MKRSASEANSQGNVNQGNQKKRNTGSNLLVIDNILEDAVKRSDEEISSNLQFKHLKNYLSNIQNNVRNIENELESDFVLEIEARFGTISRKGSKTTFVPALQSAEYVLFSPIPLLYLLILSFFRLKSHFDQEAKNNPGEIEAYDEYMVDYSYPVDKSQIRISTDDDDGLEEDNYTIMKKLKIDPVDISMSNSKINPLHLLLVHLLLVHLLFFSFRMYNSFLRIS